MKARRQPTLSLVSVLIAPERPIARPELRGNHVVYRRGEPLRCPGCGRSNWLVGRTMAECAFCETALPIASDGRDA